MDPFLNSEPDKKNQTKKRRNLLVRVFPMIGSFALMVVALFLFTGGLLSLTGGRDRMSKPSALPYLPISAEETRKRIESDEKVMLLDVRNPHEFEQQHIPGSVLLPISQIAEKAPGIIPDQDTEIIVYCQGGVRSKQAASILAQMGYHRLYDLGGIVHWPYEVVRSY